MISGGILLLSFLVGVSANCEGIRPGFFCRKECCSQEEESALIESVKAKFYEKTTDDILDKLNHNHPNRIFFDLFYPDTPRYAIPAKVEAAAKSGRFSSNEVVDFELIRKMGVNIFTSEECKKTDFISSYLRSAQLRMEKSHAIYQALLVADEIKKEILSFPLSQKCFEHAFQNGLFNSHSCNSCGAGGNFPKMRACTNLCENIVNGCYYVLTRLFERDYQPFKESLIALLKERAREERALLRNEISLFLTDSDVADGVACSGQPTYEVEYRFQRLLAIPQLGRERSLSSQFRILLRAPEVTVPEFLPIQPNAANFCRNKGHLAGNSNCFNGHSLGTYTGDTLPLTSPGQEKNQFKSFGGTAEDYAKLTALLDKLTKVTEELQYQGSI